MLSVLLGRRDDDRVKQLEKKVSDLEAALLEVTYNFKKLTALSLRLGEEVDNLAQHIKSKEKSSIHTSHLKKNDDFYN